MYSEEDCWQRMRLQKDDVKLLARELNLDRGVGYIRTKGRYQFEPLEALVAFLSRTRLA